jgi:hypothetical protein
MKTLMIAILAALVTTVSAQEFRAPLGPQKPVRAMETPPPVSERPKLREHFRKPLVQVATRFKCSIRGRRPATGLGGEHIVRSQLPRKMERH